MISITSWAGGAGMETSPSSPFKADFVKRVLLATLKDGKGRPFRVSFIKRSDGTIRHMRALLTQRKADGKPKYNAEEKNLLPVIDLDKKGWRSIPLDSVFRIGFTFEFRFENVFSPTPPKEE